MLGATAPALARIAAVIHGFSKMYRTQLAPAMVTEAIRAPAAKRNLRRSIPAAIVIVMEAGSSIRPVSTGALVPVGTAARQTMTTLRTA